MNAANWYFWGRHWKFSLVLIALMAAFVVAVVMTPYQPSPAAAPADVTRNWISAQPSDDQLSVEACEQAKTAVLAQLKAPANAKFPGCVFGANEYQIKTDDQRKTFSVFGYVDSQNSFGALIRSRFGVILDRVNGQWSTEKVSVE